MEHIDLFILSKDRACQLDLLLRSKNDNFPIADSDTWILYKASNDFYEQGYDIIRKTHPNVHLFKEKKTSNLCKQTRAIFTHLNSPYILLSVDDNVFINKPIFFNETMVAYKNNPDVCSLSIRINEHINFCQPANLKLVTPQFINNENFLLWDWTKCDKFGEWGYPHPFDSHIYRNSYVKKFINTINFRHSGSLESQMNMRRDLSKPYLMSLKKSCLISIPNNCTQEDGTNITGGDEKQSTKSLNTKYLEGYRISTDNLYGINNTSCHVVIPFCLMK